jgi:hypothetical protein
MNCPVCDHPHFSAIQSALSGGAAYLTLAPTYQIPVFALERHFRHQRRVPLLDTPTGSRGFHKSPYEEKLMILVLSANQALKNALEDNDLRAAHRALTRLDRYEARLDRWQDPLYHERLERYAARRSKLEAAIERSRELERADREEMNVAREVFRSVPDVWEIYCQRMRDAGGPGPDSERR